MLVSLYTSILTHGILDARLPEELLSLLLDAPSTSDFPDEILGEFPTSIRGYLLSWHLVFDAFSSASYKVRNDYSDILKAQDYMGPLLGFMFDVLGHSDARAINLDKVRFDAQTIRSYDMWHANDSESTERDMQRLLVNLYYQCLKYTPNLAKTWWMDCKSKQTRNAVKSWTERFFSPIVIADSLDDVLKWAEEQKSPSEDEKELIVKASKKSREVFAGYEVDDMMMQIVIRMPTNYPLEGVKVDGVNRVAVGEKKWTSWLMITQGVITFSVSLFYSRKVYPIANTELERKHYGWSRNLQAQCYWSFERPDRVCHLLLHHLL